MRNLEDDVVVKIKECDTMRSHLIDISVGSVIFKTESELVDVSYDVTNQKLTLSYDVQCSRVERTDV